MWPGVLRPGPGLMLCSTSTWWHLKKLLPASKHSTITVSSFCCRAHIFFSELCKPESFNPTSRRKEGNEALEGDSAQRGPGENHPLSLESSFPLSFSRRQTPMPSYPEPQKSLWSLASMETTALGLVLPQPPFPTLPHHPKSKPNKLARPRDRLRTCFSLSNTGPHVHTLAAWPHQHVTSSNRPYKAGEGPVRAPAHCEPDRLTWAALPRPERGCGRLQRGHCVIPPSAPKKGKRRVGWGW